MSTMQYTTKFAYRNLLRHPWRSLSLCLCMAFSIFAAVWVFSVFDGLNLQIEQAVKNCDVGDFQIQTQELAQKQNFYELLNPPSSFIQELKNLPELKTVSPEVLLQGHVSFPQGSEEVNLIGGEKENTETIMSFERDGLIGTYYGIQNNETIIGKDFATKFNLHIGESFVFYYQDAEGQLKTESLFVKGIYHKNGPEFERRHLFASRKTLLKLLWEKNTPSDSSFNRVVIVKEKNVLPAHVLEKLNALALKFNQTVAFKTWRDINPEMGVVIDFQVGFINMIMVIIAITILITVMTPVMMIWQERKNELLMLKTLGVSEKDVLKFGLVEALLMGAFSFLLAIILMMVILGFESKYGIDLMFLTGGKGVNRAGIRLEGLIYPLLKPEVIFVTFSYILTVLILSYYSSIKKIIKMTKVKS